MTARRSLALALTFVVALGAARADVLLLKDGRRFEGTVKSRTAREIVFETRFGELTFPMAQVSRVERGKTPAQEFAERWKSCAGPEAFYALGRWAEEHDLASEARKAMKRVRELDPDHEGAARWLGLVQHRGRWMTPEERDRAVAEREEAAMRERGLVLHDGQWVTLADKAKLDRGLVRHEGRWLTPEEKKRLEGLVLWNGEWVGADFARAQEHATEVLRRAGVAGHVSVGTSAAVAGPFDAAFLDSIAAGLDRGRERFDGLFACAPGPALCGGRLPEFYVWGYDSEPYLRTAEHLTSLTDRVPPGWADAVKGTHGFVYWHPFCVSSARAWGRPEDDLAGHSYHHLGHVLINRHRYTGRLLPPWFDEGFASLLEFHVHGRNAVFCVSGPETVVRRGSTSSDRVEYAFDTQEFRRGTWRETLRAALDTEELAGRTFDRLAQKRIGELTLIDVAMAMGVVSWLEAAGEGALDRFQGVLQATAPDPPERVIHEGVERHARYDRAFAAAVGTGWRDADEAWRTWFRTTQR